MFSLPLLCEVESVAIFHGFAQKGKIPYTRSVGMVQILTTNCWLRKQQGIPWECRDCSSPNYSFEFCVPGWLLFLKSHDNPRFR